MCLIFKKPAYILCTSYAVCHTQYATQYIYEHFYYFVFDILDVSIYRSCCILFVILHYFYFILFFGNINLLIAKYYVGLLFNYRILFKMNQQMSHVSCKFNYARSCCFSIRYFVYKLALPNDDLLERSSIESQLMHYLQIEQVSINSPFRLLLVFYAKVRNC